MSGYLSSFGRNTQWNENPAPVTTTHDAPARG